MHTPGNKEHKSPQTIANHVVDTFQSLLDSKQENLVGDNKFDVLRVMIREVLSEHTDIILGRFEEVIKQLKSEVEKSELEL